MPQETNRWFRADEETDDFGVQRRCARLASQGGSAAEVSLPHMFDLRGSATGARAKAPVAQETGPTESPGEKVGMMRVPSPRGSPLRIRSIML